MKIISFIVLSLICQLSFAQQSVIVLGIAQDGGFPHIGCQNECQLAHQNPELARFVVSLALIDTNSKKWWLFEATPDMDRQLQYFKALTNGEFPYLPEGIFLTHAHIGHYTGLMYLGREALGAKQTKVYGLPKMVKFISANGPWSQLVELQNIELNVLNEGNKIIVGDEMKVTAFQVPHRDEFSETAGYEIITWTSSYLFIPDIDKWDKWNQDLISKVKEADHAFLDAASYKDGELPNRAMNEIPHPFVEETMKLFENEAKSIKNKIVFIHLNHTNPLLFDENARSEVMQKGFRIAEQGEKYD